MVVGLPWLGFGVFGAVAGFSTASVLVLLGAWLLIGRQALSADTMAGRTPVEILRFEIFVIGHVAVTNLLMQADLLMVKALYTVGDSNAAAGLYGSAAKLAQIPHSLLVALNFLIFPFIARATAAESISQARGYVREALRIGVALTAGPAIVLASIAAGALALVFGPAYTAAAPTLAILAGAYIAFSLLTMATTIMNSAGKPGVSLAITAGALVMQFGAARQLIAADGLEGVATASASAYLVGLAAGIAYLVTRFGNIVPWSTIGRVAVAAGVVTFANRFCGDLPAPVAAVILGAVYLVTLVALREWTVEDIQVVTGSRGQSS
jgi:O-antigen/teichoic acid export membrane protein